ncbi:hypothetical protein [Acidiphilium sp.]|uniref:hypothetical protein n=1 Tax=Acidiphilium sp. TaxID=527 RepID=UPI0025909669|nr:hypothetical protein [Acidiphilium sp.]
MIQDQYQTTTMRAANNNNATIGAIRATLDRQITELLALTASPGERAWLAQIATQAIERGLSAEVAS